MITETEKRIIDQYIDTYAPFDSSFIQEEKRASLSTILEPWAQAKEKLFKLFGEKLIITKEIEFPINEEDTSEELYETLGNHPFLKKLNRQEWPSSLNFRQLNILNSLITYSIFHPSKEIELWGEKVLKLPIPDSTKTIDIYPTSKIMKIIGKIAQAYEIEGYEDFRIAHSQILNKKTMTGTFNLSIHPLDYMTMSDNDSSWESCMSWMNEGAYRAGTVEMMNSPYVVVGYLQASEPMKLFGEDWNNKKWRCLFIVHDDFICKVKSYPYQNKDYETALINELASLYPVGHFNEEVIEWDGDSDINGYHFHPATYSMYNDFGTTTHYIKIADSFTGGHFNYSGLRECVWCGETCPLTGFDREDELICTSCTNTKYCCECGDRIHEDEVYVDAEGYEYCEYCYNQYTFQDEIDGKIYGNYCKNEIYLVPSIELFREITITYPYALFSAADCEYIAVSNKNLDKLNGIETFARYYFIKEAEDLTKEERQNQIRKIINYLPLEVDKKNLLEAKFLN